MCICHFQFDCNVRKETKKESIKFKRRKNTSCTYSIEQKQSKHVIDSSNVNLVHIDRFTQITRICVSYKKIISSLLLLLCCSHRMFNFELWHQNDTYSKIDEVRHNTHTHTSNGRAKKQWWSSMQSRKFFQSV